MSLYGVQSAHLKNVPENKIKAEVYWSLLHILCFRGPFTHSQCVFPFAQRNAKPFSDQRSHQNPALTSDLLGKEIDELIASFVPTNRLCGNHELLYNGS